MSFRKFGFVKAVIFAGAAGLFCFGSAHASALVGFDADGYNATDSSITTANGVGFTAAGVQSSTLSRGAGLGTIGYGQNSFSSNGQGGSAATLGDAISKNEYSTFSVAPTAGFQVSISDVAAYLLWRNDGGTYTLESSATGFGTAAGNDLGTFFVARDFNNPILETFNFTPIVSTTPVEFRLYTISSASQYNERGIGSTNGGDKVIDLQADGSVTQLPEPASLGMLLIAAPLLARRKRRM